MCSIVLTAHNKLGFNTYQLLNHPMIFLCSHCTPKQLPLYISRYTQPSKQTYTNIPTFLSQQEVQVSMSSSSPSSLVFTVTRNQPEFITPAKPTPHELKYLSDIDDQEGLRFHIPVIQFYQKKEGMVGKDPVKVIKEAIAKALVYYYPFAGRLREGPNRKLMVECTGEGVLFIEADADVGLHQFGDALQPPFPGLEDLLYDVPGSSAVLSSPLVLIQVTRLRCGGFILALRLNHTMSDAPGLVQFMNAIGEIARGAVVPSVDPVWNRDVFNARDPPRVSCLHPEYNHVSSDTNETLMPLDDMAHWSFFVGPQEASALKKHLPSYLHSCSMFEILTACLWRCRTIALGLNPNEEVRVLCIVNARGKFNPPLPVGYYGNAFAFSPAISTAGELCSNPLEFALQLVRNAKNNINEEYMRSLADLMVIKGRPHFTVVGSYLVSDVTHAGFRDIDFGWGKAVYGGPAKGGVGAIPGVASFYIPMMNKKGENGIVVPICLPGPQMERFVVELRRMMGEPETPVTSHFLLSSL